MIDKVLKETIYKACLNSAKAMGSDIKTMSWFGKNHKSLCDEHPNCLDKAA